MINPKLWIFGTMSKELQGRLVSVGSKSLLLLNSSFKLCRNEALVRVESQQR